MELYDGYEYSNSVCGGVLYGNETGSFTSLQFPMPGYPASSQCTWILEAPTSVSVDRSLSIKVNFFTDRLSNNEFAVDSSTDVVRTRSAAVQTSSHQVQIPAELCPKGIL